MAYEYISQRKLMADLLGGDPYAGFNALRFRPNLFGWNSDHEFLTSTFALVSASIVIEVGVWNGGSSITMARALKAQNAGASLIAVDTWLGSSEHYEHPEWFPQLLMENGYPSIFYTFLTNVIEASVHDVVIPLPLDSWNAFQVLSRKQIKAQVIHIDATHDFDAVLSDLRTWWQVLAPAGYLILDDYDWPSVHDAVHAFLSTTPHEAFEAAFKKARFRRPKSVA